MFQQTIGIHFFGHRGTSHTFRRCGQRRRSGRVYDRESGEHGNDTVCFSLHTTHPQHIIVCCRRLALRARTSLINAFGKRQVGSGLGPFTLL